MRVNFTLGSLYPSSETPRYCFSLVDAKTVAARA